MTIMYTHVTLFVVGKEIKIERTLRCAIPSCKIEWIDCRYKLERELKREG